MKKLVIVLLMTVVMGLLPACGTKQTQGSSSTKTIISTTAELTNKVETEPEVGKLVLLDADSQLKVISLSIEKITYTAGAVDIIGKLETEGVLSEDWIGVVPSSVSHGDEDENDAYDEVYEYLEVLESGKFELSTELEAGSYDLRVCDDSVEVAYLPFVVK